MFSNRYSPAASATACVPMLVEMVAPEIVSSVELSVTAPEIDPPEKS